MCQIVVVVVAAAVFMGLLGSITSSELSSPCPGLFHYDSTDQPNQWSGTVTLLSDADLHGIWITLIFDGKLTGLDVEDNFGTVVAKNTTEKEEFLIKNREFLLKAGTLVDFKITAKFEGDKIPTFSGYRLNARVICSPNSQYGQIYPGDLSNKDFLPSQPYRTPYKESETCGTAPLSSNKEVQNGRWPWEASISIQSRTGEKHVCEATLVTSRHVLTPAHCVTYQKSELVVPRTRLTVYLGKDNHRRQSENKETQKLGVAKILLYPGYRSEGLLNDLAVVLLDEPVIISDYVRPVCLRQLTDKSRGFLVGYGIKEGGIDELAQAEFKIGNGDECLAKNVKLEGLVADNVLCGTYLDVSDCVGSSGSSVVAVRDGPKPIWELKGIVTVGPALQDKYVCDGSTGVLLLNVANYLKWIQTVVS